MRFWIQGLALAAAMMGKPAFALTTGECMSAQQGRAEIAAAGMSPIIVGNRSGYGYPTALIFFANTDGSKGVALLADKPFGEQATIVCVQSIYRDIHLNDITKPGIPAWARMSVEHEKVAAICARGGLGWQDKCMPIDTALSNSENNGAHVMFVATGTAINPRDQSVRDAQRILISMLPNEQLGGINAVTAEGAAYRLSAYSHASYTQYGQALLEKQN